MKNFTFARKWHEVLNSYSEEIQKEVYRAAIEYAFTGVIVEMQPLARMAFDFIRYEIDEKARRREARLAKKQAQETTGKESATTVSKKEEKTERNNKAGKLEKNNTSPNTKHSSSNPSAIVNDATLPTSQPRNRTVQPIWPF